MFSTYVKLLWIFHNLYFDKFPFRYKLPLEYVQTKRNGVRLSRTELRFPLVVSFFPAILFAAAVFLFVAGTFLRFPLLKNSMGDVRICSWVLLAIVCFSGFVIYTLWMLVHPTDGIFMLNEIFQCEEELKKCK